MKDEAQTNNPNVSKSDAWQINYLEHSIGTPFTKGNQIDPLLNGDEIFPAMLGAIKNAQFSILFETYVYWTGKIADRFSQILAQKAQEGIKVRVLLDSHGASEMAESNINQMLQAGVLVKWFRPLTLRFWDYDKRTHRKILVCDNSVGFTGGVGIAQEWEGNSKKAGDWRETHFRIKGPAVSGLCGAFWNNWIDIKGERLPDNDTYPPSTSNGKSLAMVVGSSPATHQSEMELVFESLLLVAKKRITLTTPYFNIRQSTIDLLKKKANEGIIVEILLPDEKIDKRFEYHVADECIKTLVSHPGIEFYRYQTSMIHAKIIRIDDSISCVGSPNFNQRSRKKDFEIAVIIYDPRVAQTLDEHFASDLEASRPIDAESIQSPTLLKKAYRNALMLFKEQL